MTTDERFVTVLRTAVKLQGVLNGSELAWGCYGLGLPGNFLDTALTRPFFSLTLP